MTTPFTQIVQDYEGVDPGGFPVYPTGTTRWWLGRPVPDARGLGGMVELPGPSSYTKTMSQGEVEQGLASGMSGVTRLASPSRRYELGWTRKNGRAWQVIQGFYLRAFGYGPWAFLAPEDTNRLTRTVSLCGAVNGAVEGWLATAGTTAYASDGAIFPSGRIVWSGAGNGSALRPTDADVPSLGCPYVAALPWCVSASMSAASGSPQGRIRLRGIAADGVTTVTTVDGATVTLSTSPQQLSVACPPGALGASVFVGLTVQSLTASAPDLSVSAGQLESASEPSDWAIGSGVPRVIVPAALGDLPMSMKRTLDPTLTLAEAVPGAA